jgi:hypothetical protein
MLQSSSSEIPIIQHIRVVLIPLSVAFYQKKSCINQTGKSQGQVQKGLHKCLYINHLLSTNPLFPTPSTSSVMRTTENTDEGSDDHKPADGDIQMEYSSD